MKLQCSVILLNRLLPSLSMNSAKKYKNAVISVIKPSKTSEVYLILILQNIEKTFGQFINEGKFTIRFKEPPHDLCITAEKIPLKNFMLYIKNVWKGEEKNVPIGYKEPTPQSRLKSYRLDIKKKDYPHLKGFPNTLQNLSATECNLKKVDSRILKLKDLTSLNLSKNELKTIPIELSYLALRQLILADNDLQQENWLFLSGTLVNSLQYLDISGNKTKHLPASLSRCNLLKTLKVSRNLLSSLPFRICLLAQLQNLDLSYNNIIALPGTIRRKFLKKLDTLDVSNNEKLSNFDERSMMMLSTFIKKERHLNSLHSLLDLAAHRIINSKLKYDEETLPRDLVKLLDNASQCICERTVLKPKKTVYYTAESKLLANTFVSTQRHTSVPVVFSACPGKLTWGDPNFNGVQ